MDELQAHGDEAAQAGWLLGSSSRSWVLDLEAGVARREAPLMRINPHRVPF
jgi:hypothetical protein